MMIEEVDGQKRILFLELRDRKNRGEKEKTEEKEKKVLLER